MFRLLSESGVHSAECPDVPRVPAFALISVGDYCGSEGASAWHGMAWHALACTEPLGNVMTTQ